MMCVIETTDVRIIISVYRTRTVGIILKCKRSFVFETQCMWVCSFWLKWPFLRYTCGYFAERPMPG